MVYPEDVCGLGACRGMLCLACAWTTQFHFHIHEDGPTMDNDYPQDGIYHTSICALYRRWLVTCTIGTTSINKLIHSKAPIPQHYFTRKIERQTNVSYLRYTKHQIQKKKREPRLPDTVAAYLGANRSVRNLAWFNRHPKRQAMPVIR
jgi:hypothetical protein